MAKYEKILLGITITMITFFVVIFNMDFTGHKMKFEENSIKINGEIIKIDDIESVNLLEDINIGNKINGTNTYTYLRGIFEVEGGKKATVNVYNNSKPYIKIVSKKKLYIYNDKEGTETIKTYKDLVSKYDIKGNSKVDEAKFSYEHNGSIISYLSIIPAVFIFICLGIYSFKKKTPMFFWAGSTVSSDEINDVKSYNRANGIMWIFYGLLFLLIPILVDNIGSVVIGILGPFIIIGLIITYKIIYNKYKVK
ncbi:hypothetical protein [Clostridium sp.]|uniref:hypothetical protein n=1 Tax=Clostridium sp. TaxID=1506 RepID=UPI002FCAB835